MADLTPPPDGNTTLAPLVNIICTVLLFLALAVYGLRIYVRFKNLSLEDYIISLAVAISVTELALVWQASRHGYGRHNYYVSAKDKTIVFRYLFGLTVVGQWSATLIRVSVAMMLLRLKNTRTWKILLRTIIAMQIGIMVGVNVCQLVQCRPIRAMWDTVPNAHCWNVNQMSAYGRVYATPGAACDILFTIMLISLVRGLHRHRSEKILLGCLMSLGTFASVAAIVKIAYMDLYDFQGDSLRTLIIISLLTRIEEAIGIIAACTPYLKNMIASWLGYLGVKLKKGHVWYLSTFGYKTRTAEPTGSIVETCGGAEKVEHTDRKRSAITTEVPSLDLHALSSCDGSV